MTTTKVAITLNSELLVALDQLVAQQVFPSRSKAIQAAVQDKLAHLRRERLVAECSKLDPREEQQLAEEMLAVE